MIQNKVYKTNLSRRKWKLKSPPSIGEEIPAAKIKLSEESTQAIKCRSKALRFNDIIPLSKNRDEWITTTIVGRAGKES